MWEDPIVAEVHRTREQLAAEHGFEVKAIFADLRKRQVALGERLVCQPKRAELEAEVDWGHHFGPASSAPTKATPAALNPKP